MEYVDVGDITEEELNKLTRVTVTANLDPNITCNKSLNALGMSVKIDLAKRRRGTQTCDEQNQMLARCEDNRIRSSSWNKIIEAANVLSCLETNVVDSLAYREALATRMQLRSMALKNLTVGNYKDAILQAHYSLLLAKKFHMETQKVPLSGEMAMELLILSKCYGQTRDWHSGKPHLLELKFLVENTLVHIANEATMSPMNSILINCDEKVFPSIVFTLAEMLLLYGMHNDAILFFEKYIALTHKIYGPTDLKTSDAINSVCIQMLQCRMYLKALPLAVKALEIHKHNYGDHMSTQPNMRVADSYCNVGIIYRLLNNPIDALKHFLIAIDMKMNILKDRSLSPIQDILLSIGCCLHSLGRFNEAAAIYRETYSTRCSSLGSRHHLTMAVSRLMQDLQADVDKSLKEQRNEQKQVEDATTFTVVSSGETTPSKNNMISGDQKKKQINKQDSSKEDYDPLSKIEVSRIQALYAKRCTNLLMPIAKIMPTHECIIPTKLDLNVSKFINAQVYHLPILNIPRMCRGKVWLNDGQPIMECNQDAADLLARWNLSVPSVNMDGSLICSNEPTDSRLDPQVVMYIPIMQNGEILRGFYNQPVLVPNPGIFHVLDQTCIVHSSRNYNPKLHSMKRTDSMFASDDTPIETTVTAVEVAGGSSNNVAQRKESMETTESTDVMRYNKEREEAAATFVKSVRHSSRRFSREKASRRYADDLPLSGMNKSESALPPQPTAVNQLDSNQQSTQVELQHHNTDESTNASVIPQHEIVTTMADLLQTGSGMNSRNAKFIAKIGALGKITVRVSQGRNMPLNIGNVVSKRLPTNHTINATQSSTSDAQIDMIVDKKKISDPSVFASLPSLTPMYRNVPPLQTDMGEELGTDVDSIVSSLEDDRERDFIKKCVTEDPRVEASVMVEAPQQLVPKVLTLETINDKMPMHVLSQVRSIRTMAPERQLNRCMLLDEDGQPLVSVPWQLDFISLSLARSCLSSELVSKYAPELYVPEHSIDQVNKCSQLLAGEGLYELGLDKLVAQQPIPTDLTGGLGLDVPKSVLDSIEKQSALLQEQIKMSKASPPEPGKKAPPLPSSKAKVVPISKKAAPKGKGAPKPPPQVPKLKASQPLPTASGSKKTGQVMADDAKVRRFFWDPIFGEEEAAGTYFATHRGMAKVEKPEVEELFAKAAPKAKVAQAISKPKAIQLLADSKKSYNMNIGLSKFSKYTFKELREAIVNLNPTILTSDATESLLGLLPTPEELCIVSEYVKSGGDVSLVDRPEQFIAVLIGIPMLRQRIEAHQIALLFKDSFMEISEPLDAISDGCEAILSSWRLNVLANYILEIGNTLNEGDPKKGNAVGFKPTTFAKLNDFKTTTKPIKTLLQYICDLVARDNESALGIFEELRACETCTRIDFSAIELGLNKLKNDLTKVRNACNASKSNSEDCFNNIMSEFLHDAEPKLLAIQEQYQGTISLFKETARYIGYSERDLAKLKLDAVFKIIWSFATSVENCRKQRLESISKEEKKQLAQSRKEKANAAKQVKRPSVLQNTIATPKVVQDDLKNICKELN